MDNKYFWMRKVIQHIDKKPQPPTHTIAQSLINTYNESKRDDTWKKQKLLESFCIKCKTKQLYNKVYTFFNKYDWATHIGQFVSGRSIKDWDPATRLVISKTHRAILETYIYSMAYLAILFSIIMIESTTSENILKI